MRGGIHQPSRVQRQSVSEQVDAPGVEEGFAPEVHGDRHRHGEAHQRHDDEVVLLLVREDGVAVQIGHVDSLALVLHFRMLLAQEPSDVGEEEASLGVVRVRVGLAVLVVDSVVPGPVNHRVLELRNGKMSVSFQVVLSVW